MPKINRYHLYLFLPVALFIGLVTLMAVPSVHADPPLGPSLTAKDTTTTLANAHTIKFTSGCTLTVNGNEADYACTGSGGTITSVTGTGAISCNTVGGAVTCTATPAKSGAIYGDGSTCQNAVFDGASTVCGLTPAANVYTMVNDIYCNSCTVNNGVTLKTVSYVINDSGTLTNNGTIIWKGNAGSGTANGGCLSNLVNNHLGSSSCVGSAGGSGSTGNSNGSGAVNGANFSVGGLGATGGGDGTHTGGAGGLISGNSTSHPGYRQLPYALTGFIFQGTGSPIPLLAGTGGGGGAATTGATGGGGGSGGGFVIINAATLVDNGTISVAGGDGANCTPGSGSCGGGASGGGGLIIFIFTSASGTSLTAGFAGGGATAEAACAAHYAPGGVPGNGGGASGVVGGTGAVGTCVLLPN